ncbi:PIG-L family deacetylase [Taibaiella helva]|uniref:PIG-L family deacetylase n=1 Tax=Taibaiella helva TaxID=2301235 RepID=UPI000E581D8A|nr:PIG-L family deacetylase [Taibaiella helva]
MKKFFTLFALTGLSLSLQAQQYRPMPSAEIYQKLQQLNVLGTVMYVAAHPDDENTRLISYLVHHDHVRTVYLSLTRGDGGQNILGNEQGSTLGLIRTHELMEARKIDGAEQLFTHVIDFGYTKSPEETFKFWNRNKLTDDVMAAFQQYRPDVIICRFPTTGEGGHGQHTVSAIVAGDAFKHLEQMKQSGKPVWVPTRLFFNAFRFGSMNTTSEDQFKVPVNQFDPLLGEGYGEMAGRSRSIHKSQGAGTPQSVGINNEYFKLLAGAPATNSLYDGIDLSWGRVGRKEIGEHIQAVIDGFNFKDPSQSLHALAAIRKEINTVSDPYWKNQKLSELNDIVASCAGVMLEALTDNPESVAGKTIPVTVNVITRSKVPVSLESIGFPVAVAQGSVQPAALSPDMLQSFKYDIRLNTDQPLTEPYWLRYAASTGAYQYDSVYAGAPETPNRLAATVTFKVAGEVFSSAAPVSYKKLDPVKGDVVQQLRIVPEVSVAPLHALFIYDEGKSKRIGVRVRTYGAVSNARLVIHLKDKELAVQSLGQLRNGLDTLYSIEVPVTGLSGEHDELLCSVEAGGKIYNRELHLIQYPHLPDLQYLTDASMKIVRKDWKAAVKKIGYIEGAGDHVAEVLGQTGLDVDQVPESAMSNAAYLSQFDAIVLGVRAYNTKKQISSWMPVLMQYVANGGTLLVQYNTNQNLQTSQYGPYPFSISRDRVTEEDATVTFTDPQARLLHFPNEITGKDFDHWVQERGIYYPTGLDPHYKTLLSMHDTGEKPLESAIIYTPYGKGRFIYTSLVFFRQLPAGNNGAIKLMMNLLSAGK